MAQDEVGSLSLKLTEEDIRQDCKAMGIPYTALHAVGRRLRAQNTATQMSDVLYIMLLAKSRGLNPVADNYSLIPRPDGNGFGTTFNKEAALHVINLHPKVKKGSIARRIIVTGKGERIDLNEHPEKAPGGWKLADIDWDMTAIYEVDAEAGGVLRGFAKYRNCVAAGRDGNPKFLWLKDPTGMTMKQAAKDLANTHLDGALPDEDAIEGAQQAELASAPKLQPQLPTTTPATDVIGETVPSKTDGIVAKAEVLGISKNAILATLGDSGMTFEEFEKGLDQEIARREAAKNGKVTRTQEATPAVEADKPKATEPEKPAEEKKGRAKKPPKPVISVTGFLDAAIKKLKDIKDKKGNVVGKQVYYVLQLGSVAVGGGEPDSYYLWDSKLHEAANAALGEHVQIDYVLSPSAEDPTKLFNEVKAITRPGYSWVEANKAWEYEGDQSAEEQAPPEAEAEREPEARQEAEPELPEEAEPTTEATGENPGPLFEFFGN